MLVVSVIAGAFLLGSIPWGWWLSRRQGVDIRAVGSGNIGAANVAHALGLRWGLVVLLLDAAKGALPVFAARFLWPGRPDLWAWVALSAVLGHVLTPWLRGRGGKGVATGFGGFAVVEPIAAGVALGVFLITLSLASLVALASLLASLTFVIVWAWGFAVPASTLVPAVLAVLVIGLRHGDNIQRMVRGQESRIRWGRR